MTELERARRAKTKGQLGREGLIGSKFAFRAYITTQPPRHKESDKSRPRGMWGFIRNQQTTTTFDRLPTPQISVLSFNPVALQLSDLASPKSEGFPSQKSDQQPSSHQTTNQWRRK
jgi:hypothetical protein